jgi:hypothetical protein
MQDGAVVCDRSVGKVGDRCWHDDQICSLDHQQILRCEHFRRVVDRACRGSDGCREKDGSSVCDQSFAREGDDCSPDGKSACSIDTEASLRCIDHHFAIDREGGCSQGVYAKPGDPFRCGQMGRRRPFGLSHSVDANRDALVCDNGKFVAFADVSPSQAFEGAPASRGFSQYMTAACPGIMRENTPCDPRRSYPPFCSEDGHWVVECISGAFQSVRPCPRRGCEVKGGALTCD